MRFKYRRKNILLFRIVLWTCLVAIMYLLISYNKHKDFYFVGPCMVSTSDNCSSIGVQFYLFTHETSQFKIGEEIIFNETSSNLRETFFVPRHPTKIIVHGFNADMNHDSLVDVKNEYSKKGYYNIIFVNWDQLSSGPCYVYAVKNLPNVGTCLAKLIWTLQRYGARDIHVIGFSLGAHVAGFSANSLRPYKLPRITGLDPAMPLFLTVDRDQKLDSTDAEFVDIIHTNAFGQGQFQRSGHADFFMNWGIVQPGCWTEGGFFSCNHERSVMYFAESINSDTGFWGWSCPGFVNYLLGMCPPRYPAVRVGDNVDPTSRGFYIVKTRNESPFAAGKFEVYDDHPT